MRGILAVAIMTLLFASCQGSSSTQTPAGAAPTSSAAAVSTATAVTASTGTTASNTSTAAPHATAAPTATKSPPPAPTRSATAAPTASATTPTPLVAPTLTAAQTKAEYRTGLSVRDLTNHIDRYHDWKLFYQGTVLNVSPEANGDVFMQVRIPFGEGANDTEDVVYRIPAGSNIAVEGLARDSKVALWGRPQQMTTVTNALGQQVSEPLLLLDFLQKLG